MKILARVSSTLAMMVTGVAISINACASPNGLDHYTKRTITVNYSDLDLSSRSGVATLYHRLERAAHEGCGPVYPAHSLNPAMDQRNWKACYRNALDSAAAKVDNRQLSQVVYSKTGARISG